MSHRVYRFRSFRLDPAARELHLDGELLTLPTSAIDCLAYLVEHRDRAVGREELIAAVWGRADVTDKLLGQTIVRLRRTLGDTGDEQHAIRTVPRFGYRWVAETTLEEPAPASAPAAETPPLAPADTDAPRAPEVQAAVPQPRGRRRLPGWGLAAALAVIAVAALAMLQLRPSPAPMPSATATVPETIAEALVLPARVEASSDWAWLRLGLMDLIGNRLRQGGLSTVASESVVGLLRQRAPDEMPAPDDPALAASAHLRVQPQVRLVDGAWQVRLEVASARGPLSADARAADVLVAARTAADVLLLKLGHPPPPAGGDRSLALDELLQRTQAAMLADQLPLARTLIEQADPALRERPELEQRLAQIDLRAGRYDAAEQRLQRLLAGLDDRAEPVLRARALNTFAAVNIRTGRADAAATAYAEAIALLEGSTERSPLGLAYLGRGLVALVRTQYDAAAADLGRARVEMQAAGDALGVAQVDLNLGLLEVARYHPAAALPMLQGAEERFERLAAREERVYALAALAGVQGDLLEHAQTLATTERFWPPDTFSGNERLRWLLVLIRADVLGWNGRLADAQAQIEQLRAGADPQRDAPVRVQAEAVAARLAWARGDAAETQRLAAIALTPALRTANVRLYTQTSLLHTRALRVLGERAAAADATRELRRWVDAEPDPWRQIHALLAEAEQAWTEDRRDAALAQFARAMAQADAVNIPEERVAVAETWLPALLETGDLETARAVAGRVAGWADRDLRAAILQARLFHALQQTTAWQAALEQARALAGERRVPIDL
jgi:DNA-binding winged helix-turn-helix (wHTH) protein/tetratricopeptide (TPR) repeat protein